MTERIPCTRAGCSATILPATAEKTGGYCMPCQQDMERQKRQQYIKDHRRDVNLFEGITDPVAILMIMHKHPPHDPLIHYIPYGMTREQLYLSLSEVDSDRLLNYAISLLDLDAVDIMQDIMLSLICYKNKSVATLLPEIISRDIYYPAILFKDASKEVRNQLLFQVEQDRDNRNHLLLALAWIGDDRVVEQFREWRESPPQWVEELYVPPDEYAHEAGWELTEEGTRRDLFYRENYALEKVEEVSDICKGASEPISLLTESSHSCPWCGGKLTTLLDLKASNSSLQFLLLVGEKLTLETCINCSSYYGVVYMEVDSNREPRWSSYNQRPNYLKEINLEDYDDQSLPINKSYRLSSQPRNSYHATHWTLEPTTSQIGGHPTWIQDAEYPICPCCSKSMKFIGQLDWGEVEEYGEGIYYMFACRVCNITATTFQQS